MPFRSYDEPMSDSELQPDQPRPAPRWRGPTISEIARAAGLGTATVDRVLNARGHVRETTRIKVMDTLAQLSGETPSAPEAGARRIAFISESGSTFNRALQDAVEAFSANRPELHCTFRAIPTTEADAAEIARLIEQSVTSADGLVLVAREDLAINRAIRQAAAIGFPIVCVTTDLPSSGRLAYVGCDQSAAGATAAHMMGRLIGPRSGKILLGVSAPYRCQEERELGFRRVIRSEFAGLSVDERVNSNDQADYSYGSVRRYIEEHGAPLGIYNVAGGNAGIARALHDTGLQGQVVFIGHELHANSRMLLESGGIDFVIGHDMDREVELSVATIAAHLDKMPPPVPPITQVRLYSKYNCN